MATKEERMKSLKELHAKCKEALEECEAQIKALEDGDAYPGQRDEPADVKSKRAAENVEDKAEFAACNGDSGCELGVASANACDDDPACDKADHRAAGTGRCQPASHQHAPGRTYDRSESEGEQLEAADISFEGRHDSLEF